MQFSNADGIEIVTGIMDIVMENRDYLSQIDGEAGDGDHGINMSKGMSLAKEELETKTAPNMSEGFMTISKVLMSKIGGSMGPLYGSFFRGLGIASKKAEMIDAEIMSKMLNKAYGNIRELTEAKPGDKTLIDVLNPAIEAFDRNVEDFPAALVAMQQAARIGMESTKDMVAKIGRSSRLGERSRGHQDAGATSCCIILTALAEGALKQIRK